MGSKPPKPPDPYEQAAAQRGENIWTSQFNTIGQNANQYGPYGNVINTPGARIPIYDQKGNIQGYGNQWNQRTELSPAQQAIFNQENAAKLSFGQLANQQMGMAKDILGKPITTEGLTPWERYEKAPALQQAKYQGTDRKAIEDAMMTSFYRGVNPQYERENAAMTARGMGAPGSEYGYATEQARGDTAGEATRQAFLASGEEARQEAAEARNKAEMVNKIIQQGWLNKNTWADQGNQLRTGQWGEQQGIRNQILNELSVLAGNAPTTVPQGQAFEGSAVNPFDIAGAENQSYANKMANYQNKQSGIFGLLGAGLSMINPFLGAAAGGLGSRIG